ncbi:MAG: kinase, partial [Elusimicrobiota bacterium]
MIISRTPYRLSFFGGGTDYSAWSDKHGGLIIGSTFARYCYISCRFLPPFFEHKTRVVYSLIESVKNHTEIKHPAVRGCLSFLSFNQGLEIHHDGDLPARSGLGSSSSFTVGLLNALYGLRGEMRTKRHLADNAIFVEQKLLNEHVGIQDQILSSHGGLNIIEIGENSTYRVSPLILPFDYKLGLESHVLLGFTGLTRFASDIAGVQVKSIEKGETRMGEIHAIAKEALELFRSQADFRKIGDLLHKSWEIKRSLAKNVSNDDIDLL